MPRRVTVSVPDPGLIVAASLTFLAAGVVKGIVGFGMPTVALAALAAGFGLKTAIALTVFPVLVTNVWQAVSGGNLVKLTWRLLPMLLMIFVGIYIGSLILARTSPQVLTIVLGVLVCLYALTGLARWRMPPIGAAERWASPPMGFVNGIVTGTTGTFIMPGILYLQALNLPRTELVQAMGIVFCLSTAALGASLTNAALLPRELAIASAIAIPPAIAGMWLGRRISDALSDAAFDRAFFWGLLIVGAFLIVRNAGVL
jgi:uncharacterized membrane protein YfcA